MLNWLTRRATRPLRVRIDRLVEQRDYQQTRADIAQNVATRTAKKFADVHDEAVFLRDQVAGYDNLLARHARLLTACARYRAEARLRDARHRRELRQMTERALALEAINEQLRTVNDRHYRDMADRGATPIRPAAAA